MESADMGSVDATIELMRGDELTLGRAGYLSEAQVHRISLSAMVDSGATLLTIPTFISDQLQLSKVGEEAELADGSSIPLEVVGPVKAPVVPNRPTVLRGAIPMKVMDVLM